MLEKRKHIGAKATIVIMAAIVAIRLKELALARALEISIKELLAMIKDNCIELELEKGKEEKKEAKGLLK